MHYPHHLTNNWTNILTAFGTLGAVLAAFFFFFYERIKNFYNRPIPKINVNFYPPECHKTKAMSDGKFVNAYWFRLYVHNMGKSNATNLEVLIERVDKLLDGKWQTHPEFLPSNLMWTHINVPILPNLLPGTMKNVDLGHILDPNERYSNYAENNPNQVISMTDNVFFVNISVQPFTPYNIIEPGEYIFHLTVGASNSKPIQEKIHLKFNKDWEEDESKMLSEVVGISTFK